MLQASYPTRKTSMLLKPSQILSTVGDQRIVRPKSSCDRAVIVAVGQLIEHQEHHGSDAVPPEDVFASWLEENKERFVEARRVARKHSQIRNVNMPRTINRKTTKFSSTPQSRGISPGPRADQDGQASSRTTGIRRRRVCNIRKGVCNLLSRAGAAIYPAGRRDREQLDVFEKSINYIHDHPDELSQEDDTNYQNFADQEQDEEPSANDNHNIVHRTLKGVESESKANPIDEPHPGSENESLSGDTTAIFDRSERESAPPPPERRGFHISQVAHLAPTYIAAQRSRSSHSRNGQSLFDTSTASTESNTSNSSKQVVEFSQAQQQQRRRNSRKSSNRSSVDDRDALRTRIRAAGLLSGEVWVDGLDGMSDECVGVRFVARPLGEGVRLLPRASRRKGRADGLDY
ncbi:hypothetical protein F4781DRAFT_336611 [Annulohypoxylon bovei var. microspora]|nr:hypothetical protein F4781DRAFT_336611 [Annulohypoxylon bovei var. microspora]